MKQSIYILLLTVTGLLAGCTDLDKENPYDDQLHSLQVTAVYPDGYSEYLREGVTVKIEDVDRGNSYKAKTDKNGVAQFSLTKGIYRVQVSDKDGQDIFNGLADNVKLTSGNMAFNLPLIHSRAGAIIIKEIYCGGCTKLPLEGNYQSDKYIILHNNDSEVQYLDSLCFGALDPYNSQATNVWVTQDEITGATIFRDFAPIVQCIWQFGGTGKTFPLQPGEDAVIAINGAVDHAALVFQQESGKEIFVWFPTIGNNIGCPLENRFHPIEVFFIQLGMESNDSGNRCFYLPVLLHVEQTAKLKQEIFFVGREWNTVVFPANADGFQRWFFGEEGVIGTIFICTISFCILSFCMKNVFCHTCICCICFFCKVWFCRL